jgi:hypothetical protein
MQTVAAVVAVISAANWVAFIGGLVLAIAEPSAGRSGAVTLHALVTALLVWIMFRLLEQSTRRS